MSHIETRVYRPNSPSGGLASSGGVAGQVTFYSGASAITSSSKFLWNDTTGALTAGAASGTGTHTFNGKVSIASQAGDSISISKTPTQGPSIFFNGTNGASSTNDWRIDIEQSTTSLRVLNNSSVLSLNIDQNGKHTIGQVSGSQFHRVYGRGLDIMYGTSGVTAYLQLVHSVNAANSGAGAYFGVGGGSAGDAFCAFNVASATDWIIGIDNSDSDKFVFSSAAALGSSNVMTMTTAGLISTTQQLGIGTSAVTTAALKITMAGSQLTGTTQYGVNMTLTGTSAGTSGFSGYQVSLTTQAAAYTCPYVLGVEIGTHAAGSGSTITRAASFFGSVQTSGGTGNAWGCDNVAFSGDYVLNFSSTKLSYFAGKVAMNTGLAVGNSAAATTLGSVVKKMQVFAADGSTSLGYVPIYDAIT